MGQHRGTSAPALSRRTLLRGTLAAAALGVTLGTTSCGRGPAPTVTSLIAEQPFSIAHRGGGGDWPEMTGYAYEQAAKLKTLKALEISVCVSADGVLVCSHDPSTLRTTGVDLTIGEQPWSVLSQLKVNASTTNDPNQPAQPLTRFDEVVERYLDRFVVFVEPKVPEAADALMAKLVAMKAPERVVWKQYVTSPHWDTAKRNGFGTWGYLLNQPSHIDAVDRWAAHPGIDLLGAGIEESDDFITRVVAAAGRVGKKTIAWPISSAAQRERALQLGVNGLMTSDIAELLPTG